MKHPALAFQRAVCCVGVDVKLGCLTKFSMETAVGSPGSLGGGGTFPQLMKIPREKMSDDEIISFHYRQNHSTKFLQGCLAFVCTKAGETDSFLHWQTDIPEVGCSINVTIKTCVFQGPWLQYMKVQ